MLCSVMVRSATLRLVWEYQRALEAGSNQCAESSLLPEDPDPPIVRRGSLRPSSRNS
jgi:hypothetical protein